MVRRGCRQIIIATLAAAAALGGMLPGPVHAQQKHSSSTPPPLVALRSVRVGNGSGVLCSKLGDYTTHILQDNTLHDPACVILVPPGKLKSGDLEAAAARFSALYKLKGYRTSVAKDGSAVFLLREGRQPRSRDRGMKVMLYSRSLATTVLWLNSTCGGSPNRVEGTRLVWKDEVAAGNNNRREMEVSLNLLRPMPAYLDIRLRNVNLPAVADIVSGHLGLELKPVSGSRGSNLRKKLGVKPLGYMTERFMDTGVTLVRVAGENGLFRLGAVEALEAIREKRGQEEEPSLPELNHVEWPDTQEATGQGTSNTVSPMGSTEPPGATQPAGAEEQTDNAQPGEEGAEAGGDVQQGDPAEASPQKNSEPPATPSAEATPTAEEARKAYAERLRAL